MAVRMLWQAESKQHRGSLIGILVLVLCMTITLSAALTIWRNSRGYVHDEMERLGFGDITFWVSGVPDAEDLAAEIDALPEIRETGIQPVIFSEYEINGQQSDSEGQLIAYEPSAYDYRIFTDAFSAYSDEPAQIHPGEVYVSPSMYSAFGARIGDKITFQIARNGIRKSFRIGGWYEDPFMGSSMIGMKGFLIGPEDYALVADMIPDSGIDGLARDGYMLHVSSENMNSMTVSELNSVLNEDTSLSQYMEFAHSQASIEGFMLTLQNVFTGFLMVFAVVLALVLLVVLGHSVASSIEQNLKNTAILIAVGFTGARLQAVRMLVFLCPVLAGMCGGMLLTIPVAMLVSHMTVTTTGILIPASLPYGLCLLVLAIVLVLFAAFIWLRSVPVSHIRPVQAIRDSQGETGQSRLHPVIEKKGLPFWLALRRVNTARKRYVGILLVGLLLTFFTALTGRMSSWLGPDGKGLMDAFNPADLHVAAQPMGESTIEDVEEIIRSYSDITDQYMLAMPSVSVNGTDYTANVITDPGRFHMLRGSTVSADNEIVLTDFVAADLGVDIGDTVTVGASSGVRDYVVAGIYQCANDMGDNVGMSREGYDRIGEEVSHMWCVHYMLSDVTVQPQIMQALEQAFGADVYLHENSWPGLYGILGAMRVLTILMYSVTAIIVLVVTALAGSKSLAVEQDDMALCRALGFTSGTLRLSFALRFVCTALLGALLGLTGSLVLTDPLVSAFLRSFGISDFHSHSTIANTLFPVIVVAGLFGIFAFLFSRRIRTRSLASFLRR